MASKPQASHTDVAASSDGTTDYQPLRSGAYDMKKPHITELPMTWRNWYQHLDWLSIYFILIVPISGLIAATQVSLRLYTGIFAVAYYVVCGSGITAGMSTLVIHQFFYHVLIPKQDIIVSGHTRATRRLFRSRYI
jgi:stearoyl-CoA desaturase (delta-9 desaturase)